MVVRNLSAVCLAVGLLSPLAAAAPRALEITVDGAVLVENNVRVGGATEKGARVALYRGAGCRGEPVGSTRAEEGGSFTVAADGFTPPFTVSVRASAGERRSECVDIPIR
jgi:hypothetical protein